MRVKELSSSFRLFTALSVFVLSLNFNTTFSKFIHVFGIWLGIYWLNGRIDKCLSSYSFFFSPCIYNVTFCQQLSQQLDKN